MAKAAVSSARLPCCLDWKFTRIRTVTVTFPGSWGFQGFCDEFRVVKFCWGFGIVFGAFKVFMGLGFFGL